MGTVSNIKVEPCNVSWKGTDLGFLDGDLEVTTEEQGVDITAHQEGTNVLDMIRTGKNVEITTVLKEVSESQLDDLLEAGGAESVAAAQVVSILIGSVASINSKYFDIYSALDAITYRVWFDVNNTGVAPSSTGVTLVEVDLDATPTIAEAVTALQGALDALAAFVATESGGTTVTVTNAATGSTSDPVDTGATGFTFTVTTQGIGVMSGWGNSKDFTGMVAQSGQLVMHPIALGASDRTKDLNFWLAYPLIDSIVRSGENPTMVSITWKIFPDPNRQAAVRLFAMGDGR